MTGSRSICSQAIPENGDRVTLAKGEPQSAVIAVARDYPNGWIVGPHCHADGQFIHATDGVMEIRATHRLWLVPPGRAVWMPPRVVHELRARGAVSLRTLYIMPEGISSDLGSLPAGYAVTPLLRELILRAIRDHDHKTAIHRQARLVAVLLDELTDLPSEELSLAMPSDVRLARACQCILADPGQEHCIADLAALSGASVRTLTRLAREDLGCTMSVWRQQARILAAVPMLIAGESVMQTATALGYETPSAFAAMFRRLLGATPRDYASQRRK